MTNTDLSTLCSDLLLQWETNELLKKSDIEFRNCMQDLTRDETFENFLHKNLNPEAKVYIYERSCPFMSKETLDAYFGNVAFVQHTKTLQKNTFNVRLIADCDEYKMTHLVSYYDGYNTKRTGIVCPSSTSMILRIGLLKWFFAEKFDPFQETMKRILAMEPTKEWMEKALDKENPRKQQDLIFSFADGQLLAIL